MSRQFGIVSMVKVMVAVVVITVLLNGFIGVNAAPTFKPTTKGPTSKPSASPTKSPTAQPTNSPTVRPSKAPTTRPTLSPSTSRPTLSPSTSRPTLSPSTSPSTSRPTQSPSTSSPTLSPSTSVPSQQPTTSKPTATPTSSPSTVPTRSPTKLAVFYNPILSYPRVIYDEVSSTTFQVTNILSTPVDISFVPCDATSASWISSTGEAGPVNAAPGQTVVFNLDLHVQSGFTDSWTTPSTPITGCVRINATTITDWEPQFHDITVQTNVAFRCEPGSYSPSGDSHPNGCSLCPLGTYSNTNTATQCTECPEYIPRTLETNSSSADECLECPVGEYCPVAQLPQKCPMGAYEPVNATLKDRNVTDCVRFPCQEKFWCGAGAAENSTYVQAIEYGNMRGIKILIKQRKTVTLDIVNLVNATIGIELSTRFPMPYWLRSVGQATIPPLSDGSLSVQLDSTDIPGEKLEGLFFIDWFMADRPSERFQSSVNVSLQVVTLIVNPPLFDYSFTVGDDNNTILPVPQIEVVNTLCNNSVTFSISPTCRGVPLASWIIFPEDTNPTPFASRLIEEQRGLPEKFDFSINISDPIFDPSANASLKHAPNYTTCFDVTLVLNGLSSTLTREIPVTIHVMRPCPPGMFSPKGDDSDGCTFCAEGYYQSAYGRQFCDKCPDSFPRTLFPGSTNVEECLPDKGGFVSANGTLATCPRGAICDQVGLTVESLRLQSGFWRASAVSTHVLDCPRPLYCVGGTLSNKRAIGRSLQDASQPSPDGVCRQNHTGPFCYSCIPGYYKRTADKVCMACSEWDYDSDKSRVVGFFVGMSILFLFLLTIFFWTSCRRQKLAEGETYTSRLAQRVQRLYEALDISIPLQIMIGFIQVVGGMSTTFQQVLPPFFFKIRDAFSIFALDLVQVFDFGCTLYAQNHFSSLLITSLLPIGVSLLLLVIHIGLEKTYGRFDAILRHELRTTTFSAFLVLIFLVYPSCSVRILATFACQTFDDGQRALVTDPSVDCNSDTYMSYYYYAIFMTLVYPVGVPVFYSILLYRERKALNPYSQDAKLEKVAEAIREKNRDVKYLRFLWKPYKTRYFWFEVFEQLRKLSQTSIVVFVASGSSGQMIFQLLVTTISIVVMNALLPYVELGNNLLALIAQWAIFGISIITLLTKLNKIGLASGLNEYNQTTLDSFLFLMFFIVPSFGALQVLIKVIGGGALRQIFFCFNWDRIDRKVEKLRVISVSRRKLQPDQGPDQQKKSFTLEQSNAPPKTFPEALDLSRRLRDNLNVLRRDLTDKYEQERARAEVLEDERAQFERRTVELEAELEKARLLLAEQENNAARQAMIAQDALDRAHAEVTGRRTVMIGRKSNLSNPNRTSDLGGGNRKTSNPDGESRKSNLGHAIRKMSILPTSLFGGSHHVVETGGGNEEAAGGKDHSHSFFSNSLFGRNRKTGYVSNSAMPAITEQGESKRSIIFVREKELRDGSYEKQEQPVVSGDPNNRKSMRSIVKERENLDGSFQVDVEDE